MVGDDFGSDFGGEFPKNFGREFFLSLLDWANAQSLFLAGWGSHCITDELSVHPNSA